MRAKPTSQGASRSLAGPELSGDDGKRLATASHDRAVRVWDLASAEEGVVDDPLALAGYRSHVWAVAFDARDRVMSVTADGIVRTWPSSTDALRQALWRASPHCLAVDRKGRTRDSPVDAQRSY